MDGFYTHTVLVHIFLFPIFYVAPRLTKTRSGKIQSTNLIIFEKNYIIDLRAAPNMEKQTNDNLPIQSQSAVMKWVGF